MLFSLYLADPDVKRATVKPEEIQTVFGIVWDVSYYKRHFLLEIQKTYFSQEYNWESWIETGVLDWEPDSPGHLKGMLLLDYQDDTLFTVGRIDTADSLVGWRDRPFRFGRLGWKFFAQDHLTLSAKENSLIKNYYFRHQYGESPDWEGHTYEATALVRMLVDLAKPLEFESTVRGGYFAFFICGLIGLISALYTARKKQRDYIAHISHELRTPVAQIRLFAETMRHERFTTDSKPDEYLDNILCTLRAGCQF